MKLFNTFSYKTVGNQGTALIYTEKKADPLKKWDAAILYPEEK